MLHTTCELSHNASLPAFGDAYHWGFAHGIQSKSDAHAKVLRYGSNFTEGTYEPENGWITEQNEDEDTFATGWKDIPDQDGKKTFIVQYEFADGSKANHVYDLTDVV